MIISAMCKLINFYEKNDPSKLENLKNISHFELDGTDLSNDQNDTVFSELNFVMMQMPKLENIKLIGTGIGENLSEITETLRQPGLKNINLARSGITKDLLTIYTKHMFNFENVIELDLSANWFGT